MPLKNYGVLKGKAVKSMMGTGDKPHYQVLIQDDGDVYYRIVGV